MDLIKRLTEPQLKENAVNFNVGDTVRVHAKIKEGNRERIQVFEGTVIALKHGGIQETVTVRRMSYGVGVEKTFPVHSPNIEKIEVVRRGKVRRAKLYYLRGRVGKAAKVKQDIYPVPPVPGSGEKVWKAGHGDGALQGRHSGEPAGRGGGSAESTAP